MSYRAIFFLCFACALGGFTHAQSLGILSDQITLDTDPRVPQALEPVEVTLTSYNTDLDRARISLYIDGVLISREIGKTTYTVDSPRIGSFREVRFSIETIDAGVIEKSITLRPGQVDLLYEALDSHTPVFYKGKKLPAHEGGVRVVALPYFIDEIGRKLDPKTLVYSWKVGTKNQVEQSGYGKDTFVFIGSPFYRTKDVTVHVESVDGKIVADRIITLPAYNPVIRFYEVNPLWGRNISNAITANQALTLNSPEVAIEAVPFFFSDLDSSEYTPYEWRMNGSPLSTFGDRNIINLRAPDSEGGEAQIRLRIMNNNKILQIAESLFVVVFGESEQGVNSNTSGTNFFGTSEN